MQYENIREKLKLRKEHKLENDFRGKALESLGEHSVTLSGILSTISELGLILREIKAGGDIKEAADKITSQISHIKGPEMRPVEELLLGIKKELEGKKSSEDLDYNKLSQILISAVEPLTKISIPPEEHFESMVITGRNARKRPLEIVEKYKTFKLVYSMIYDREGMLREVKVRQI